MSGARHPALSIAAGLLALALLATLAGGCGSSGTSSSGEGTTKSAAPPGTAVVTCAGAPAGVGALRVGGADCATGRKLVAGWTGKNACTLPAGASHVSCTVSGYRCLAVATERGLVVGCGRPGRSISFVAKRR